MLSNYVRTINERNVQTFSMFQRIENRYMHLVSKSAFVVFAMQEDAQENVGEIKW